MLCTMPAYTAARSSASISPPPIARMAMGVSASLCVWRRAAALPGRSQGANTMASLLPSPAARCRPRLPRLPPSCCACMPSKHTSVLTPGCSLGSLEGLPGPQRSPNGCVVAKRTLPARWPRCAPRNVRSALSSLQWLGRITCACWVRVRMTYGFVRAGEGAWRVGAEGGENDRSAASAPTWRECTPAMAHFTWGISICPSPAAAPKSCPRTKVIHGRAWRNRQERDGR